MPERRPATLLLAALIAVGVAAAPVAARPVAAVPVAPGPVAADVRAAIGAVEAAQAKAWNDHDARGYAALFAADADVVNVLGWWWQGRDEIEAKLRRGFASVFSRSRLTIDDVAVRSLAPGLVIAHVGWSMSGATSPDGSGANIPERGLQTQVLRRDDGRWLIVAFHNTNAVPEREFPAANAPANPAANPDVGSTSRRVPIGGPVPAASATPPAPVGRCLVGTSGGSCLMRGKPPKPVP